MAEPLPPDPYVALGVSKDASSAAIKSAYRKAVLKCHPDKAKGREDEFHKIQAAFEIVGDDEKRQKYDDTVYLDYLRKESRQRRGGGPNVDVRTAAFDFRSAPNPSATFTARGPTRVYEYEERRPKPQYNDEPRYDPTEENRASSRKYDGYEPSPKKAAPRTPKAPEEARREPKEAKMSPKERAYQKKQRAKDTVRERERKYAYAEDVENSDEGYFESQPRRPYEREPPRRRDDGFDKHNVQAADAREYMNRSRVETFPADAGIPPSPPPPPQFTRSSSYKEPDIGVRKSGKDQRPAMFKRGSTRSAKTKTPEPVRRSSGKDRKGSKEPEIVEAPPLPDRRQPPPLQTHFSSPAGSIPKEMRRSKTAGVDTELREPRRTGLHRAETLPPRPSAQRNDTAPMTPSGLRNTETHDSGYSTSSPSTTPPPPPHSAPKFTSTRYPFGNDAKVDPVTAKVNGFDTFLHEPEFRTPDYRPRTRQRSPEEMAPRTRRPAPEPTRSASYQPEPTPPKSGRRPSVSRTNTSPRKPKIPNFVRGASMPGQMPKAGRGPNDPVGERLFGELPRAQSPTENFDFEAYHGVRQVPAEDIRIPNYDGREFLRRSSAGGEMFGRKDFPRDLPRRSSEHHFSEAQRHIAETRDAPFRPAPRRQQPVY